MNQKIQLDKIEDAIDDFRDGKMIVVVDDEDRENEGDLIVAAEKITPEQVNFMLKNARGVLCAPITLERCAQLELAPQVQDNTSVLGSCRGLRPPGRSAACRRPYGDYER